MPWEKKGFIFNVDGTKEWALEYASIPFVDKINDNKYRIYFSSRNSLNRSSVGYFEWDVNEPKKISNVSEQPILEPGKLGTFDDTGVMATSIVNYNNKKYLYYVGWNQPKTVPFRWSIGLAISHNNGATFERFSDGPIVDRNPIDPYFASSPSVILDGDVWRMYYISGTGWKKINDEDICPYNIRYAESKDGINWIRNGTISVDFKNSNENKVARANVFKENDIYKMFYCYAINEYHIGYAESKDGIKFDRKDHLAGIESSSEGWDSKMIEYPFVLKHNDRKFLFYNGNEYGQSGIGYAEWN